MTHTLRLLVATGWSICSLASVGEGQTTGERLCARETRAQQAYIAHDRAFLSELFAEEFQHVNSRGGVVDKAGEIGFFTSPDLSIQAATIDSCAAHVYRHVAVVAGIDTWVGATFKGSDLSGAYRFTRVYVWRDRRWQVVASHFSKIVPNG